MLQGQTPPIEPTCCCLPPGTRLPACTSPAGWPRSAAPPPAPESVARTEAPAGRPEPELTELMAKADFNELSPINVFRQMKLEQERFVSGEFLL